MTAFYVLGALLAAWALVVTALGVTQHGFPRSGGQERLVASISIVLVLAAVSSAIIGSASEDEEEEGGAKAAEAGQPAGAGGGTSALQVSADPEALKFDKTQLTAEAGKVTITMDNPSSLAHNVSIEGGGVDEEGQTVGKGEASTVTADVEAGEYTFYCSVPGHQESGMEGTLTVQ